ncbi:response regulator [Thermogemmatispora carboxidivorans]|uniref:response regulator n=1 Tax=Thermogemmatispora carboxidivorans TaxID=1382306 RepID=UPI00069CA31E|nr:response regulator [Thermogemmatispora carboxidivorans]
MTSRLNVLIVDDDPLIREMMIDILEFEGYHLRTARNGQEALQVLQQGEEHYVVFLDLMMPIMDGSTLCRQLAAQPELRHRHRIILMSAMNHLAAAASLQADGLMPKPFSVEDVLQALAPFRSLSP